LSEIRLGFLRKGSADLIGKILGMPDQIEQAAVVFADSIVRDLTLPCDILQASCPDSEIPVQHFVGYGGAEIFGRIPHFTENRFMKWYKGILGQIFGDLGPFSTGMTLALGERICRGPFGRRRTWRIRIDGRQVAQGRYQALIIQNGYLGPELAFSSDPLGSGHFQLIGLKDIGWARLPRQILQARRGTITKDPGRWGLESFQVRDSLELATDPPHVFPANIDGTTLLCPGRLRVAIVGRIRLLAAASNSAE
jgi:diacylglycerol kinase family enzyme